MVVTQISWYHAFIIILHKLLFFRILHLQVLQNIFTETNQSIKSYNEIHKDLKDAIKETEERIKVYDEIINSDNQQILVLKVLLEVLFFVTFIAIKRAIVIVTFCVLVFNKYKFYIFTITFIYLFTLQFHRTEYINIYRIYKIDFSKD